MPLHHRRGVRHLARASLAQQREPDFMQPYTPPHWHPQLAPKFRGGKRAALGAVVADYYGEVWNHDCVDLLDELAAPGVVFSDTLGLAEDCFGVAGLRQSISEFQAAHPLLRYTLVSSRGSSWGAPVPGEPATPQGHGSDTS